MGLTVNPGLYGFLKIDRRRKIQRRTRHKKLRFLEPQRTIITERRGAFLPAL